MNMHSSETRTVKSACPYCGVGCGIVMDVTGNRVTRVSGDKDHPANRGRLCTKGMTSAQAITATGRLDRAFMRTSREAEQGPVGLDAALDQTAGRLKTILETDGPDAIALYISGQMSMEAQYLANKLAKGFIRTQHIESNSRLCMASAASGYKLSLGADGPPGSYDDIDAADLFLVIGSNMADCHPILYLRMMDRVKEGAKLIVVDPRRTPTAAKADLFLQIRPGTDLALLNGILHLLLEDDRIDRDFIAAHTDGWEAMPDFLADYAPDAVAALIGLSPDDIRSTARLIGAAANWMSLWTMGLNQSTHGTWSTNAICNLHLATGTICRTGSGPFSLTGQPNAMGGREMGYMGAGLPGQRSTLVEADRRWVEDLWGLPADTIRAASGPGTIGMFEAMKGGQIKACWIICTNPVASIGNRATVIEGLKAADLVITQDVFLDTETNLYADILLPGALWAEAEGVMVNSERTLTLMQKAVDPPGQARADWWIIAEVAKRMGYAEGFTYADAAAIFDEIRAFANPATGYDMRGATHARLRETPLQWPLQEDGARRNPVRYRGPAGALRFPTETGKAHFFARPHLGSGEMPDDDHPFVLNTGRLQHQWHTMTKTGRIPALTKLNPGPFVEISPLDAQRLSIEEGDRVEIRSRRGFAVLPAVVTERVLPGCCFAPFHWNDIFANDVAINAVTRDAVDPISLQPALKYCAVSLTRIGSRLTTAVAVERSASPQLATSRQHATAAFSSALGIASQAPLRLDPDEETYLQGFIIGLQAARGDAGHDVPLLPPSSPLSPEKRLRLNGVLAGLFSRETLQSTSAMADPGSLRKPTALTIAWASQTGTAEELAKRAAGECAERGLPSQILPMDALGREQLLDGRTILFVTSTFGDGDPPDNGAAFWDDLATAKIDLSGLVFSVLCLGDSSYSEFCGFGRKLDQRLEALGGRRLMPRIDCDGDGETRLSLWLDDLPGHLAALPAAPSPKPAPLAGARPYTRREQKNPATDRAAAAGVTLVENSLLSGKGSAKETRQIVFDLSGSGLCYEAGDALGVWPSNCPALVAEILSYLRMAPDTAVDVPGIGTMEIGEALGKHYEIARITPDFLRFVADHGADETITAFAASTDRAAREAWLWGRQMADVLAAVPVKADAPLFLAALKRLQPRLYSISSSPSAHADRLHLTVSTVRYRCGDRDRKGVCSSFFADRALATPVPVFVRASPAFRLPADSNRPVIMIGPGTGIAPFHGFLAEREAKGAGGRNWLLFGEQHRATDFYYREALEGWQRSGLLTRLDTAFSRDGAAKIYVQDRMIEGGPDLWRWLEDGAVLYVCGDASRMAKDVDAVLHRIVETQGGMDPQAARAYVTGLSRDKRYLRDVY